MLEQVDFHTAIKNNKIKEYTHDELVEAYQSLNIKHNKKIKLKLDLSVNIGLIEESIMYICGGDVDIYEKDGKYHVTAEGYNFS